MTGSIVL